MYLFPCRFEAGFNTAEMSAAVEEAVSWAEGHPLKLREIVKEATQFATGMLNRDAVDCYLLQVLRGVADLDPGLLKLPNDVRDPEWNSYDHKP